MLVKKNGPLSFESNIHSPRPKLIVELLPNDNNDVYYGLNKNPVIITVPILQGKRHSGRFEFIMYSEHQSATLEIYPLSASVIHIHAFTEFHGHSSWAFKHSKINKPSNELELIRDYKPRMEEIMNVKTKEAEYFPDNETWLTGIISLSKNYAISSHIKIDTISTQDTLLVGNVCKNILYYIDNVIPPQYNQDSFTLMVIMDHQVVHIDVSPCTSNSILISADTKFMNRSTIKFKHSCFNSCDDLHSSSADSYYDYFQTEYDDF
jgi:hypothetical protein